MAAPGKDDAGARYQLPAYLMQELGQAEAKRTQQWNR